MYLEIMKWKNYEFEIDQLSYNVFKIQIFKLMIGFHVFSDKGRGSGFTASIALIDKVLIDFEMSTGKHGNYFPENIFFLYKSK